MVVSEIVEKQQMEYNLGGNTILWFSMVLLNKISENKQDLSGTFIMSAGEAFVMKKRWDNGKKILLPRWKYREIWQ